MARTIMTIASVVLGLSYLMAAAIRIYVGQVIRVLRRSYWASVVPCVALSVNQFWLLAQGTPPNTRILFGQTAALVAVVLVYVQPCRVALRDHRSRVGR